jgi:hypothetical protein
MTEHDVADKEHLGQITKAQLVAQTPEHTSAMTSVGYCVRFN